MSAPQRVVITGATSGLGRELAVQLGRRGWKVAVTGRRREQLDETAKRVIEAGGQALSLYGSVTDDAEVKGHYAAIKAAWGGLDWAILNAGVSDSMDGKAFKAETVRWTFDANVLGVARWIEAVLPDMLAQKSGLIAGVASLAGFRGLPLSGPYSASKAALITLFESLRVDLQGTGVDALTVCPGFVRSEMTDRNEIGSMPFFMETADGVAAMLAGLDARERTITFPWQLAWPTRYMLPLIPDLFYNWLARKMAYKRKKRPQGDRPLSALPPAN
jgi:short-subunit dehydrogenase